MTYLEAITCDVVRFRLLNSPAATAFYYHGCCVPKGIFLNESYGASDWSGQSDYAGGLTYDQRTYVCDGCKKTLPNQS